jgi:hypothetical protein
LVSKFDMLESLSAKRIVRQPTRDPEKLKAN